MPSLNKVMLLGNLTRDPEIRYTPKGTAMTEITLAVNRIHAASDGRGEKREEVTFVDVTIWGRSAEIVGEYCEKGRPLFVEGRLQLDTWDDKQTGQKRTKLRVIAENVQLLSSGSTSAGNDEHATASAPRARPPSAPTRSRTATTAPRFTRPLSAAATSTTTTDSAVDAPEPDIPF